MVEDGQAGSDNAKPSSSDAVASNRTFNSVVPGRSIARQSESFSIRILASAGSCEPSVTSPDTNGINETAGSKLVQRNEASITGAPYSRESTSLPESSAGLGFLGVSGGSAFASSSLSS
jgi:hypothetical protein